MGLATAISALLLALTPTFAIGNASAQYDFRIVGDFNFDGREDFAVQIDQSGSYGGPTFDVFLALPNGSFVRSEPLSRLTRERLGMFEVDAQKKHLVTFEKSGCCYHVTEELAVVGDAPVPVFRLIEDATGDAVIVTKERWVNGKWHRKVRRVPKAP